MFWKKIYQYLYKLIPLWFILLSLSLSYALYLSLFNSPDDYRQFEYVRIMYIHVPSAWISMLLYLFLGISSLIFLTWNNLYCNIYAYVSANIGCFFCSLCIISGSIWGRIVWGTWWIWDARLISMAVLLCLYIGYLILWNYGEQYEKLASLFSILGLINLPIIHFSVTLFRTLHQKSSIFRKSGVSIDPEMLKPLIFMFISFLLFSLYIGLLKTKTIMNIKKIRGMEKRKMAQYM
ncbi:MAG: heme exporter protein C [Candidatus Xenolissoclinum pacificiensis L6]|uniref:Heme exporter protein C n=1 Tax=Candidatus Xenolissoclinum pacificiensis L6 TaxID=1401685 RepID=W2UZ32_9RICK|nr:MAG: heme exporter protein C [Candidatus Xenolissoclinum pacificiensis L6]